MFCQGRERGMGKREGDGQERAERCVYMFGGAET